MSGVEWSGPAPVLWLCLCPVGCMVGCGRGAAPDAAMNTRGRSTAVSDDLTCGSAAGEIFQRAISSSAERDRCGQANPIRISSGRADSDTDHGLASVAPHACVVDTCSFVDFDADVVLASHGWFEASEAK